MVINTTLTLNHPHTHHPTTATILNYWLPHGRNTGLNAAFNAKILNCDDESLDPVRRFLSLLRDASPVQQSRERPRGTSNDT